MSDSIPPLVVEFEVEADPEEAFDLWVGQVAMWWPRGHTMSSDPAHIVIEAVPNGRIYERAADGREFDWGEVIDCERPARMTLWWHLFFPRSEATLVEITFTKCGGNTAVRIVQSGWDALGDAGSTRRDRTIAGWAAVTVPYITHINKG